MADAFVDLIRAAVFVVAHLLGGSIGGGVLAVSLAARLALLPLTLRLARRAAGQREKLARLQPELARLRERYRRDPGELWRRTQALYRRAGYRTFDPQALVGGLLQVPVLGSLYAAVRRGLGAGAPFLWVADLTRPDALLALGVAALTAAGTYLAARSGAPRHAAAQAALSGLLALLIFGRASSALLLGWAGSAAGNVVQALVLARRPRPLR